MTEDVARDVWLLWLDDWLTTGTQDRRHELLERKARLEAVLGWTWGPPYRYDNPPHLPDNTPPM